ncbi:DUF3303 family protein [Streptomyces sp. NBC_00083]|uniref:DUF3303 family protein n=1 Tax=Streptomyces sp. NBC_00083 TaxID=2975647 RepID=UPI002256D3A8|nr:DUF3303 family protein [Streptomyces sp. NBC_00083]MCX5387118.1 hypothetical protein [Streptomyces sp. NBC_00083]
MRVLLKAQLDTEKTNESIRDGTMTKSMQSIMETIRPEAAYFTAEDGRRTALIIFDMADSSEIPKIAEPFMQDFGARIDLMPVMNGDDLAKGLGALG